MSPKSLDSDKALHDNLATHDTMDDEITNDERTNSKLRLATNADLIELGIGDTQKGGTMQDSDMEINVKKDVTDEGKEGTRTRCKYFQTFMKTALLTLVLHYS